MKYAVQVDKREATEPRGVWRQIGARRTVEYPDGTSAADVARAVVGELGLADREPAAGGTDVRISVFATLRAPEPEHTQTVTGYRSAARQADMGDVTERSALGDLAEFATWLGDSQAQLLAAAGCPRAVARRFADAWEAAVVPTLPDLVQPAERYAGPARSGGTPGCVPADRRRVMIAAAGTGERYGAVGSAENRTGPALGGPGGPAEAGTPGAAGTPVPGTLDDPPSVRTGGGERPAAWTRESEAPGPEVVRIFDGLTFYRRSAADRWIPEGQSGPGFAWGEIPAALRVDASQPYVERAARRGLVVQPVGVRRRRRPQFDLPADVLDLVSLSPVYTASWGGVEDV